MTTDAYLMTVLHIIYPWNRCEEIQVGSVYVSYVNKLQYKRTLHKNTAWRIILLNPNLTSHRMLRYYSFVILFTPSSKGIFLYTYFIIHTYITSSSINLTHDKSYRIIPSKNKKIGKKSFHIYFFIFVQIEKC